MKKKRVPGFTADTDLRDPNGNNVQADASV